MFELLDGRASAFQWDTGLYVDCTGLAESDEVHFCRPGITLALHPAMQGETLAAPVPDELLQQAQPIIVFAYVQTATGEITRASARLCVIARPKPPGYIASPTEALRWGHLQEQIGDLADLNTQDKTSLVAAVNEAMTQGGDADPEAVQQIVEDYLAENPPTVAETDPTVPAWAKAAQKPSYTASEVGADPSGTAASQVSAHNTGTDTHSDIRLLISGLTDRLNALADSDDTTLDQLSEVVAYIKSNRELIAAITTDKVSVADIVDNLTTNVANKPLSAAQGVALKALIDAITVPDKLPNPNALTFAGAVTGSYDGSAPLEVEIPSGGVAAGDYIPIPASAEVGQTIVVKAVDENGKPTEWEAADISAAQTYEALFEVEEAVESVEWDFVDDEGSPVLLQEVEVVQHFISTNQSGADLNAKILLSDGNTKYVMIANNFANTAGNWVAAVSVAKIYGETLYVLSNKSASSIGSLDYNGGFTRQGVSYPKGWGDRWNEQNGVKIRGIIGLKIPGAVGAKGQFYVCGVKAK